MLRYVTLMIILFGFTAAVDAQEYYFPPNIGDEWETSSLEELGWCEENLEELYTFLDESNSKSFIVLHKGKIVIEKYFDGFVQDSIWYWASSAKSMIGFLVGMAQEEGHFSIDDPVSDYLGQGWTSLDSAQEERITIRHQLTMTTGLNDNLPITQQTPDPKNCLAPECLQYLAEPGSRWAYHNAPYRLLQNVISNASGTNFNLYNKQTLSDRIGMKGIWFNYIRYGRARDMARFGLLTLNQGVWGTDTLLHDQQYFYDMTHPSQELNQSYGYLWWLAGQDSYMVPSIQAVFQEDLVPNAPDDAYAALGKNDQKIYVVPSQDLVVVRQGNKADESTFAISSFDNALWGQINQLACTTTSTSQALTNSQVKIFPNPSDDYLQVNGLPKDGITEYQLFNILGRPLQSGKFYPGGSTYIDIDHLPEGAYFLQLENAGQLITRKVVKRINQA